MKKWVVYSIVPILALAVFWVHRLDKRLQSLTAPASETVYIQPNNLVWVSEAPTLPGAFVATVFGDPEKPGLYTIRLKLPANFVVPPHHHTQNEYLTVISGSLNIGIGIKVNKNNTTRLPLGGAVQIPSNVPHYAWTTEEMIMEIHAIGPRKTIFESSK